MNKKSIFKTGLSILGACLPKVIEIIGDSIADDKDKKQDKKKKINKNNKK